MKLGVDVRELRRGPSTGIGRYLRTFLGQARGKASFVFYADGLTDLRGLDWALARRLTAPWPFADHRQLPRFLREDGVELFFSPYYKAPWRCPCPYVVTIHDVMFMQTAGPLKRSVERAFASAIAARAAGVVTVSEYSKSEIIRFLRVDAAKIAVVPNAVPEGVAPVEPARRDQVLRALGLSSGFLLYVGGFKASKNVASLVDAYCGLLPETRLAHPLVLVGPMDGEYRRFASVWEKPALAAGARFLGGLEDAQLAALYSACALCVVPSLLEGFGMPALEAMACGAPVLASRRASLPEVVGDAGALVEPQPAALRDALSSILRDGERLRRMRAAGPARAALFSRERIGARLWDFVESRLTRP